jgi:WD40 repeat protein
MSNISQCYQILGLEINASPEDIKQAYRKLVKIWHPDRHKQNSSQLEQAEIEIRKINQAYEIIQDYLKDRSATNNLSNLSPAEGHYRQGTIYAKAERYPEAINEFSLAIRLNPNYVEAYQHRGYILAKLGFEHRAQADFQKVLLLKFQQPPTNSSKSSTSSPEITSEKGLWRNIRTIVTRHKTIPCLAIDARGKTLINGSYDGRIKIWHLNKKEAVASLAGHTGEINCVLISPDGQNLISGSKDKTIKIWDLESGKLVRTLGGWFGGHKAEVVAMAIDPFNRILISGGGDNLIKIWDLDRGKELHNIEASSIVTSISFSPDGRFFASAGLEPQLRIRDLQTGKIIRSLHSDSGVLSIAFGHSNLLAAGGFDGQIRVWNWQTGKNVYTLSGHLNRVSAVAFAKNSLNLVSASWDGTVKLWNLQTHEVIDTLAGHGDRVLALAIPPSYQLICSASADRTIKIWQKRS